MTLTQQDPLNELELSTRELVEQLRRDVWEAIKIYKESPSPIHILRKHHIVFSVCATEINQYRTFRQSKVTVSTDNTGLERLNMAISCAKSILKNISISEATYGTLQEPTLRFAVTIHTANPEVA